MLYVSLSTKYLSVQYLSPSSSYASSPVHYASDSSQSLSTAPESLLSPQVGRYGGADDIGRPADEEAGGSQQYGVNHLVIRRV